LSGIAMVAIGILESMKPKQTNWLESYSKFDKVPYGNYVLYNQLTDLFTDGPSTSFESLKLTLADNLVHTNLILINNTFEPEQGEVDALLEFVDRGNQAMIISRRISNKLLDTLDMSTNFEFVQESESTISYNLTDDTTQYNGPTYNIMARTYFDELSHSEPIGYRSDSLVNFVRIAFGDGHLFLHVLPSAFTNAFILTENNNAYVSKVLSYLPDQQTIWDEYYKVRKDYVKKSPFQQVLSTDGLRQALYLVLLGTLAYMVFAAKRRQRIIPVLPVKVNTTVEFVETIGQLYYNESDHKDIGVKRVNYFLIDIRQRYRLDTEVLDEGFCHRLSTVSGVTREEVDELIKNFKVVKDVQQVLDARIIILDKLIENFYNKERLYGK
jgi:hypothetical protein